MADTPTLQWNWIATRRAAADNGVVFSPPTLGTLGSPPAIDYPEYGPQEWIAVGAVTSGSYSLSTYGDFTSGSHTVSGIETTSGISVGHVMSAPGYLPVGPIAIVTAVTADSLTFSCISSPDATDLAATATGTIVPITITSPFPLGSLKFSVSPANGGITIVDGYPDATGSAMNVGTGQNVSNMLGQAEGSVKLTPMIPGTYSLSVEYVSADVGYASVTVAAPLSITVS